MLSETTAGSAHGIGFESRKSAVVGIEPPELLEALVVPELLVAAELVDVLDDAGPPPLTDDADDPLTAVVDPPEPLVVVVEV